MCLKIVAARTAELLASWPAGEQTAGTVPAHCRQPVFAPLSLELCSNYARTRLELGLSEPYA